MHDCKNHAKNIAKNIPQWGFSLSHIFPHKSKIVDSVLSYKGKYGQRKPLYWHILRKIRLFNILPHLTLSWWRILSYRNQSIDMQSKSVGWLLYVRDLCHETVNKNQLIKVHGFLHFSKCSLKLTKIANNIIYWKLTIRIVLKAWKVLELVSSLHNVAKN